MNKKTAFSFVNWIKTKMAKKAETPAHTAQKDDKKYNEYMVLQFLLFESVNAATLTHLLNSTYGTNIPVHKVELTRSIEALQKLITEYKKSK